MSMKLYRSRQTFKKYSNITFHENLSTGRRAVPCGRTDRQTDRQTDTHTHTHTHTHTPDEANSRHSQFCKVAQKYLMFCISVEVSPLLTEEQSLGQSKIGC